MGTPYAAYRKIVLIAVTMTIGTRVAAERQRDGEQPGSPMNTMRISELAGVRKRCETFFSQPDRDAVVAAEGEQHPAGRRDR